MGLIGLTGRVGTMLAGALVVSAMRAHRTVNADAAMIGTPEELPAHEVWVYGYLATDALEPPLPGRSRSEHAERCSEAPIAA